MKVLGLIRLAPGEVGFYDDLTRIHLTIANPERHVLAGMNTTNIKRAVRSGRLLLVSGSLDLETEAGKVKASVDASKKAEEAKAAAEALAKAEAEAKAKAEADAKAKEEAEAAAKAEEEAKQAEEAKVAEQAAETVEAEVVEAAEEAPKKKAASKKTKKAADKE
jgi:predicted ribosome quality control (RQC) complex YloA/Tae2 family protein